MLNRAAAINNRTLASYGNNIINGTDTIPPTIQPH